MVQGLRLHTLNAGGLSLIPAQGTISHVLQLILRVPQLKILHAEVKMIVHMPKLRPSAAKKKKKDVWLSPFAVYLKLLQHC